MYPIAWQRILTAVGRRGAAEEGQVLIEYALILALVALEPSVSCRYWERTSPASSTELVTACQRCRTHKDAPLTCTTRSSTGGGGSAKHAEPPSSSLHSSSAAAGGPARDARLRQGLQRVDRRDPSGQRGCSSRRRWATSPMAAPASANPNTCIAQQIQGDTELPELKYGRTGTPTRPRKVRRVCISYPTNPATTTHGLVGDPVQVTVATTYHWLNYLVNG